MGLGMDAAIFIQHPPAGFNTPQEGAGFILTNIQ
jgi:hypothetical protein